MLAVPNGLPQGRRGSVFTRMSEPVKAKYHQVFLQFDTDCNGEIDEYELHSIMKKLGRDLQEGEAKRMIEQVDSDGSHVIYFDEFLALLEMQQEDHKHLMFNRDVFRTVFNKSGSGLLTREELRTGLLTLGIQPTDVQINEMISIADRSGEGTLSFEDFDRVMRGNHRRGSTIVMSMWDTVFDMAPAAAEKYSMVNKCAKPMREFRHVSRDKITCGKVRRVPADKPKILQPTIDGCDQKDVIELEEGVYTEPIVINVENLTLIGATCPLTPSPGNQSLLSTPDSALLDSGSLSGSSHVADSRRPYVGCSRNGKTVIEVTSRHPAVTLRCKRCFLENLEIINHGSGPAVQIDQGFPDLINLDIKGQNGGLLIKNRSHPYVKSCNISNSARAWGVLIRESKAIIEDCLFTGNCDGGIVVERSSCPWIHKCRFVNGKGCGMVFGETASGVVVHSEFSGNGCAGVMVSNGADPVLWKNRLHHGEAVGLSVTDGGRGTYEENDFEDNEGAEVEITHGGAPLLRRNHCLGGSGSAVLIDDGGHGYVEDNDISGYRLAGVSVGRDATPTVIDNTITAPEQVAGTCGIALKEDAKGKIVDNMLVGWANTNNGRRQSIANGLALSIGGRISTEISGNIVRPTDQEAHAEKIAQSMRHRNLRRRSVCLTGK
ncbi:F-box protein dre-1 [Diplonema papillatum]|nr:F-box protein dre-1 [Diplonema papillatum]